MSAEAREVEQLAQNLARNCGYAVFPCLENKAPAIRGSGGYKHATTDPAAIFKLWHHHPGPLIGIATGTRSNASVLDVDTDHMEAYLWWQDHYPRLLPTRTYRTRRGGLHLWFQHRDGVTNSQGKLAKGIDTRGDGGYAIYWFATGLECLDHSPLHPWPDWLLADLKRQPAQTKPPPQPAHVPPPQNLDRAIAGILRSFAAAREGERNGTLFWCACRLAERGMRQSQVEALLLPIARNIGLHDTEARRTIQSAIGRAVA